MKEYSCDYRLYTRKICIIRGKLKNFKVQLLRSNALFLCRHEDTGFLILVMEKGMEILYYFKPFGKKNYNSQVDHFLFLLAVSSWYHFFDLFLIVVVEEKPGETRLPKEKPGKPSKTAKSKNIKD